MKVEIMIQKKNDKKYNEITNFSPLLHVTYLS